MIQVLVQEMIFLETIPIKTKTIILTNNLIPTLILLLISERTVTLSRPNKLTKIHKVKMERS